MRLAEWGVMVGLKTDLNPMQDKGLLIYGTEKSWGDIGLKNKLQSLAR